MDTVKYDVGDILTWCKDDECYATVVIVRCVVYRDYVDGTADSRYDAFYKNGHYDAFELIRRMPGHAFKNYKLVGHIDLSGMSIEAIRTELIYAIACEWHEHRIAYAVQAHWALMKHWEPKRIYIPEMTDEYCCYDGRDKLEKENRQLKEEIGSQNDKIFELNKEIDRMRDSYRNDRCRIATNLRKIGFTSETIRNIIETDMV